ncbi:RNA 2',3'-cyclic phosphodiesterase [Ethanoligenens harbinense]|uniref:RNA 2',3'-cyclic phosphodiesterase n=1 Tax=Ethanoligenens harbinense (strain DSM 18485 / JCM 12961 / CGMCC 1.5033 / YUAN-3) TaxID=663278 RepID=E6U374_ETHHY|nr:RNA 2',3'-cyclic phosphodiesterase [Ethanoligenens harbinense]ADU27546.1 2'-5' RNA ligase [Ethanoligenens harbinense YUAN-3]AVQ96595.1 RNA 2',3'-cyclic phosphodiesterase [Ethanoligenens harbinense YUAN-3]AYF39256.1 RNA 2',3'-cyclic phosphodiesterase [Ethanoligenens harbinense]AYF42080.1 RNA 2',3'-cyclic phosphodiesterase [Ethanoligenens harbinense]QCN92835.1 RNA 2',3'-cyclic phosphodiesterase [Ethanoligenens harbinense]
MRTFIAVLFEPDVAKQIMDAVGRLESAALRGHFTARENLHLTLAFLGETARPDLVEQAMREEAGGSFTLVLGGWGRFPGRGGDVVWMGVQANEALTGLQARICGRLRAAGFMLENRPYTPHITLGRRVVLPHAYDPDMLEVPALSQQVDTICLMESTRLEGRLRYLPQAAVKLTGQG